MSRIAKNPIALPDGVDVKIEGKTVKVKGKKGELSMVVSNDINAELKDNTVVLTKANGSRHAKNMWGTTSALIRNMLVGVSEGYTRKMIVDGVGFRAAVQGKELVLNLGFSHDVRFAIPQGVEIKTPKPTEVEISGIDKHLVGQVAADIYHLRKPEPYKGKGINYEGRRLLRKEGKKK